MLHRSSLRNKKSQPHTRPLTQPRIPVLGREVPITSGCENQWGLWLSEIKAVGIPGVPLRTYSR